MGLITDDNRIVCAKDSSDRANSIGLKGHPVRTIAEGFEYNNCIIFIKPSPKPISPKTNHKKDHSRRSNAYIASRDKTTARVLMSVAASITCSGQRTLSEARRDFIKPVWSQ